MGPYASGIMLMLLVLGKSQSWKHVQNDQVYLKLF